MTQPPKPRDPQHETIRSVFVYGTLKRGECRERLWPRKPTSVQPAIARGRLFGRQDYPAMTDGDDLVSGEVWTFADQDMPEVIRVLDMIEGTNQPGEKDLYRRVEITVQVTNGQTAIPPSLLAYGYHYATDPEADGFARIVSRQGDPVFWNSNLCR